MRRSRVHRLALPALAAVLPLAVLACSPSSADPGSGEAATSDAPTRPVPGEPAAIAALAEGRTVIDVRTPEEFVAGHVEGARNIDVQSASFAAEIAALDPATSYVVYCRSGNRSATAAAQMSALGLDVVDGGALTTMVAAGWPPA